MARRPGVKGVSLEEDPEIEKTRPICWDSDGSPMVLRRRGSLSRPCRSSRTEVGSLFSEAGSPVFETEFPFSEAGTHSLSVPSENIFLSETLPWNSYSLFDQHSSKPLSSETTRRNSRGQTGVHRESSVVTTKREYIVRVL